MLERLGHACQRFPQAVDKFMHGRRAIDTIRQFAPPGMNIAAELEWLDHREREDLGGIEPTKGARELLGALRPNQWAVVTSANGNLARLRLRAAGLPPPDILVSSDDVVHGKPHPEGFCKAATTLGKDPANCLIFEDAEAGILAGLAAGAHVILVKGAQVPVQLPILTAVRSFEELRFEISAATIRVGHWLPNKGA